VLRLDLAGLGESPPRPGRAEQETYPQTAAEDIADAIAFLRAAGSSRVASVGLCSGALVSFDGAMRPGAIDAIVSINGRFDKPFHDPRPDRARRAGRQTVGPAAFVLSKTRLLPMVERLPHPVWVVLDRLHLVALPTHALRRYRGGTGSLLLIFGPDEIGLRSLRKRTGDEFAALVGDPRFELQVMPGLDHSMFDLDARASVFATIRGYLARVLPVS
jgi:hypothetical protein